MARIPNPSGRGIPYVNSRCGLIIEPHEAGRDARDLKLTLIRGNDRYQLVKLGVVAWFSSGLWQVEWEASLAQKNPGQASLQAQARSELAHRAVCDLMLGLQEARLFSMEDMVWAYQHAGASVVRSYSVLPVARGKPIR